MGVGAPPFAYFGGKMRLAPWIVQLLPPHRVYVEPFAGSLAVLFAKPPSQLEVVNDIDGEIVNFFKMLREHPDALEWACRLTPYARDEFAAAKEPAEDDLERARRWWVRVTQGFNKNARLDNGWSCSTANSEARTAQSRVDRFSWCARRLIGVAIENREAADIIRAFGVPDGVMYVDPPYLSQTRVQDAAYRHEYATEEQHRELAAALHESPATVLLSGFPSPLYEELYGDWHRLEQQVPRSSGNKEGSRERMVEVLWANRPLHEGSLFT